MKTFTAFVLTAIPVLLACWVQLMSPIDPVVPDVDLPPLRELARDQRLVDAQLLFAGDVSGPESFAASPQHRRTVPPAPTTTSFSRLNDEFAASASARVANGMTVERSGPCRPRPVTMSKPLYASHTTRT